MAMQVATYCRVSTTEQNLKRQITSTFEYATDELGAIAAEVKTYRDKSTGTNVSRDGYTRLMSAVESGEVEAVVVHEISRLSRSLRDLDRSVNRVVEAGASIHFVRDGLVFGDRDDDPMNRLILQMLGAFAEWEARVKRQNTREGIAARQADESYHHGPPPLGFEKDDGRLIEGTNYDRVCGVLDEVAKNDLSKRAASNELGVSRSTIRRALERGNLYGV